MLASTDFSEKPHFIDGQHLAHIFRDCVFSVSTCRSVHELWGQGNNMEDLKQCVLKYPAKKMV